VDPSDRLIEIRFNNHPQTGITQDLEVQYVPKEHAPSVRIVQSEDNCFLALFIVLGAAVTETCVRSDPNAQTLIRYLKYSSLEPVASDPEVCREVSEILLDIERNGERAVRRYSERFDGFSPERFTVHPDEVERAADTVPLELREHIDLAAAQIRRFASAQRQTLTDLELSTLDGIVLGHRHIPVQSVGAYAPGGRHPLIACSLMTTLVAAEAGVQRIVCCAPPRNRDGIAPATLYAMSVGGAIDIVCLGGAHGVAALAFGIEDVAPVDMIVGAGDAYATEAKRQLYGRVGVDVLSAAAEILVIADGSADAELVAADLVSQLEHSQTSPGWLISTSRTLAEDAIKAIDRRLANLPDGRVASAAWETYGEVILCDTPSEAARVADSLAPEYVEVHTADPDWFLEHLNNYGSLFLGDQTCVSYGDKAIGTNHVLPTARSARFTGGLWVGSFLKTVTYQRARADGAAAIGPSVLAICEAEELSGHAVSARERLTRIRDTSAA
jgi:sulfopropanediol 3-dehydrogenase